MATSVGIDFPLDAEGKRATTAINQGAFAAAVEKHDADAFKAASESKKWRFGYAPQVVKQVQIAATSEEKALGIAKDGLAYIHKSLEFTRDGVTTSVAEAMSKFKDNPFGTHTIVGKGTDQKEFEMPYGNKILRGNDLKAQVEKWVRQGVIELDTGAALCQVADTPKWYDLSNFTFLLFGAGSAMGPFPILMSLGAHIIAIDLDRPVIWERLIKIARNSPGRLTFPTKCAVSKDAPDAELLSAAGCNLMEQTPEIRNWLLTIEPEKRLVIGSYCYLDGPMFVRVAVAMDAICEDLVNKRKVKPALAYLCTPTDAHLCTRSSTVAAADNLRRSPAWQGLIGAVLKYAKMGLSPNRVKGEEDALPICDALVKDQGPNYCLAKRLQHWRAVTSRSQGCVVSSNIAPATATASVVSNKLFALAYNGLHNFKPMEVFYQDTSNAVMAALLINDLQNPQSAAHPETKLQNPMQLFAATSFHGGAWRCGYKFGSIGPASAIAYVVVAYVVKTYLILYSLLQFCGWSRGLQLFLGGDKIAATELITTLTYLQMAEILHAALGMVGGSPVTTGMQILSRVWVVQVFCCHNALKLVSNDDGVGNLSLYFLVLAWSVTEIVRYLYYATNTAGLKIAPLTWLRYSMWPVLYPMGVSGELGVINVALPALIEKQGMLAKQGGDCSLAGSCGIFTKLTTAIGFAPLVLLWVSALYMLMSMMAANRRKVLGGGGKKVITKDKKA